MKSVLKLTAFVLLTAMVSSACSKERRIERRLSRKTGKWNIEKYEAKYYEDGYLTGEEAYSNAGYFTFDEDGTVVQVLTINGDSYTSAGTWSNSKDEITFMEDGYATVWKITEDSRKEMTLELEDSYSDGSTHYHDVYKMEIEKD